MLIRQEGRYEIVTTDEGSLVVRYLGTIYIATLMKIKTMSNSYNLSTNFSDFTKRHVTQQKGLRMAKELILAQALRDKNRVLS